MLALIILFLIYMDLLQAKIISRSSVINHTDNSNHKNKNRHIKIILFNPPFCKLTNINIGKYFLNLIDKHFPKNNSLSIIFNRNTLKISHSCTNNIPKIIINHNKKLQANLNEEIKKYIIPHAIVEI